MSDFKDSVRQLLDVPALRYGASDAPASLVWVEKDTVPREDFVTEPVSNTLTRTKHTLASPLVNDTVISFTANSETYEVRIRVGSGSISAAAATNAVVATVTSGMSAAQQFATVLAAFRALPNVTARDVGTLELVIWDDTNRAVDVAATGAAVDSTATGSVTDSGIVWPEGMRPGDRWVNNQYLRVLQVYITGGDDQHYNVVALCRADLERLAEEFDDIQFPADLAGDNFQVSYPYHGDSREIIWSFQVANSTEYTRTPQATPHPLYPEALLVSEQSSVQDGTRTVTQVYRKVGPVSEQSQEGYVVSYECSNGVAATDRYPVVVLRLDVRLDEFTPTALGTACPIDGDSAHGNNGELDFENVGLVLVKEVEMEVRNNVYGQATYEYRRVPSFPRTVSAYADFPKNAVIHRTRLFVNLSTWTPPTIGATANTWAGSSYSASYVTGWSKLSDCPIIAEVEIEHAPIPTGFTEWDSEGVRFPALYPATLSFPPSAVPYAGGRLAWAETVPARVTYSFTRTPDTVAAGMPTTQQFQSYLALAIQTAIDGGLTEEEVSESVGSFWWRVGGILHDTILIEDPSTGSTAVTATASSPSASTYRAWIAARTRYVHRDIIRRWRGDIHMRVTVEVVAR